MNILLFGGNSQRNKQWVHQVGTALSASYDACIIHNYSHWAEQGDFIDFEKELLNLGTKVTSYEPYAVFAKSVGSILTLRAIASGILSPVCCIFVGLPIKLAEEDGILLESLLPTCNVPCLFVQNNQDPVASFEKVKTYVGAVRQEHDLFIELEGSTHSYDDIDGLKRLVELFTSHVAHKAA
ncbi:MAG: hypothetical protein NVS1B7_6750 [Candidatus Saccharimonadales bacterium]